MTSVNATPSDNLSISWNEPRLGDILDLSLYEAFNVSLLPKINLFSHESTLLSNTVVNGNPYLTRHGHQLGQVFIYGDISVLCVCLKYCHSIPEAPRNSQFLEYFFFYCFCRTLMRADVPLLLY